MLSFSYALFMFAVVAVFVAGLLLAKTGHKRRSRIMLFSGAGIIMLVPLLVIRMVVFDFLLEFNPIIGSDAVITGTWTNADEKIELRTGHSFHYTHRGKTIEGTWLRGDFNLRLSLHGS